MFLPLIKKNKVYTVLIVVEVVTCSFLKVGLVMNKLEILPPTHPTLNYKQYERIGQEKYQNKNNNYITY